VDRSLVRAILHMGYAQSGCSLVFRWRSSDEEAEEMLVGVVNFILGQCTGLGVVRGKHKSMRLCLWAI